MREFGMGVGVKTAITCAKEFEEERLMVIWFDSKEDAEEFKSIVKVMVDELNEEFGAKKIKYGLKREVFYWGTSKACEDFIG